MIHMLRRLPRHLLVILALLSASGAQAYCVYNNSHGYVQVQATLAPRQTPSPSNWKDRFLNAFTPKGKTSLFQANISPGQSACCPHTEKRCNITGASTGAVYFAINYIGPGTNPLPCARDVKDPRISLPANGYITVDNQALWGPQIARVATWNKDHILKENTYCPGSYTPTPK